MEENLNPNRDFGDIIAAMNDLGFAVMEVGYSENSLSGHEEISIRLQAERQEQASQESGG